MENIKKRLESLKDIYEEAKENKNKVAGKLETIEATLKKEYSIKDMDKVESILKKLKIRRKKLTEEINEKLDTMEEKYDN